MTTEQRPPKTAPLATIGWIVFVLLVVYAVLIGGGWAGVYLVSLRAISLALAAVGLGAWLLLAGDQPEPPTDIHALFDDQPRAAAAASCAVDGQGRILLFSGSTGRYVTMAVKDRPPFPREVLAYDVSANRWSVAGNMPSAVVTTGVTNWRGRIVVASGEVRPGVRTRKVQSLQLPGVRP